jgi:hypothetical protein
MKPRHHSSRQAGTLASTTHRHHLHPETAQGSDGLWFTGWDRWCGTEHAGHLRHFDAATAAGAIAEFHRTAAEAGPLPPVNALIALPVRATKCRRVHR